jgi:LPS sulfotransferase NodH
MDTGPAIIPIRPAQGRPSVLAKIGREFNRVRRRLASAERKLEFRRRVYQLGLMRDWWLRSHTPYRPLFVIATARSGSNLLVDYLNRMPGVRSLSEIVNWQFEFGPQKNWDSRKVIQHLRRSLQQLNSPVRACKVFFNHLENYGLTLDDIDHAFTGAAYIVLYRENMVEQFVSHKQAIQTNQWLLFPGQERKKARVTIDCKELRAYCDTTRRCYEQAVAHRAVEERGVVLSYEHLTTRPSQCVREFICPLLKIPGIDPTSEMRKQNAEPLGERVANYDEIAALALSPHCHQRYALPGWQYESRFAA